MAARSPGLRSSPSQVGSELPSPTSSKRSSPPATWSPRPGSGLPGGRPTEALTLNVDRGVLLVADIGSSHARMALVDLGGTILATHDEDIDVDQGPDVVLPMVDAAFDALLASMRGKPTLLGIGVGVPGPVERATGRLVSPPTMRGWDGVSLPDHFRGRTKRPVTVDEDANVMALGVHRVLGHEADDALVLKVGMGIGAGILSRGEILPGPHGAAGDLGHIPREGGELCRCGQRGCAEASACGWAIAQPAPSGPSQGALQRGRCTTGTGARRGRDRPAARRRTAHR